MQLEEFAELKRAAGKCIDDSITLISKTKDEDTIKRVEMLRDLKWKLKSDVFDVLVIGEFSSGKSTLINAVLGSQILPTNVTPTTASVNIIQYGETDHVEVKFKDGHNQIIQRHQLIDYITSLTKEADAIAKTIDYVMIDYPSSFCRNSVRIVDTPGLNSTHDDHERATMKYLPRGCAGIMTIQATQFMSASQRKYLEQFRKYMDKMFFVVTWIDALEEDDSFEDNKDYFKQQLADVLKCDINKITLYPIDGQRAANGDLDGSGLRQFLHDFEDFLTKDQLAQEMVIPPLQCASEYVRQYYSQQEIRFRSMDVSFENFEERIKTAAPQRQQIMEQRAMIKDMIEHESQQIIHRIMKQSNLHYQEVISSAESYVMNYHGEIKNGLQSALHDHVKGQMNNMSVNIEKFAFKEFLALTKQLEISNASIQASIEQYKKEFGAVTNIDIDGIDVVFTPNVMSSIGVVGASGLIGAVGLIIGTTFGPVVGLIGLGVSIFLGETINNMVDAVGQIFHDLGRSRILKDVARQTRQELSQHNESLQKQLRVQLEKAVVQFCEESDHRYGEMLSSIDTVIAAIYQDKQRAQEDVEQKRVYLQAEMKAAQAVLQKIQQTSFVFNR